MTAIDDFVSGAISAAAKAASLPLLHSWLGLVPAPDSSETMPTADSVPACSSRICKRLGHSLLTRRIWTMPT